MPATIFTSTKVKTLKDTLTLNDKADIISTTTDPTSVAVSAPIGSLLINQTSGKQYRKLDSGSSTNWVEIGTGTSGKNYVKNNNFEAGTNNWELFNTTLTNKIPTGSIVAGAASLTTFTTTTSSPLSGLRSLSVISSGAITAGHGFISDAFTLDVEDRARVLAITLSYQAVSGTMNFSGTSDNTWAIYAYDVTNSAWIQPAGTYGMTQGSGVGKVTSCTFQPPSTCTQLRLAVICVTATAGATSMLFDSFTCGPQVITQGTPVTDWTAFTPTGSWSTNSTYTGFWHRDGENMTVIAQVTLSGAPNVTALSFNLPSGYSINTAKLTSSTQYKSKLGWAWGSHAGSGYEFNVVYGASATSVAIVYASATTAITSLVTASTPVTWANTDTINVRFTVPISGWSSQVQMSSDTDTRVVAAMAYRTSSAQTITNGTSEVVFNFVDSDSHGTAMSASTGRYTVPVAGDYEFSFNTNLTIGATPPSFISVFARVNGLSTNQRPYLTQDVFTANKRAVFSGSNIFRNLKAGDYISVWVEKPDGSDVQVANTGGTNAASSFSVRRLSGPSVIAASETVAAKYTSTTAQSMTGTASYANRVFDTHGAFNGTIFTAPISGTYRVSAMFQTSVTAATNVGDIFALQLIKNGSGDSHVAVQYVNTTSAVRKAASGSTTVQLNAGGTIKLDFDLASLASHTLSGNANLNYICIERIGN